MWQMFVTQSIVVVFVRGHRVDVAARELEEENSSNVRVYGEVNEMDEKGHGRGRGEDFKPTVYTVLKCAKEAMFNADPFMCKMTTGRSHCPTGWSVVYAGLNGALKRCCKESWLACANLPWCGGGSACYLKCDDGHDADTYGVCVNKCPADYDHCVGRVCAKKGYCTRVMASIVGDSILVTANAMINIFGSMSTFKTFIADQISGLLIDRTITLVAGNACETIFNQTRRGFSIKDFIPNLEITKDDIDFVGLTSFFAKLNSHGCR
eukprot:TRINITY_DN17242_c0_g1_i1.p1 TRINITY_DN17242_c0_g1~~TRINITY_DN17242_c0_g1_i1.p1  ORF type:complete len:265 (-),score=18.50 TRINITY_DN17242_c0_g1_i1:14-808(-)